MSDSERFKYAAKICQSVDRNDCFIDDNNNYIYCPEPNKLDEEYFYELVAKLKDTFKENNFNVGLYSEIETLYEERIRIINNSDEEEEDVVMCNECDGEIPFMCERYTHKMNNYFLCSKCYEVTDYGFKAEMEKVLNDLNFGSFLDWVNVTNTDAQTSVNVICNLNKDSKYYKKLGLIAMDDHGRCGYYNLNFTDLELLFHELDKTVKFVNKEITNDNNEYYDWYDDCYCKNECLCKKKEDKIRDDILNYYAEYKNLATCFG
jgi:hypothetical protein